ncbi:MAG TPA: hypothetical protein VJY34_23740 [Roseiarcus sp.]|nr:hypothetical protein [Roseiarcus sp.]
MSNEIKRDSPYNVSFKERRAALAAVQDVNEEHGYADAPSAGAPPVPPAPPPAAAVPYRGPFRTGRTAQLNLKASPDTVRRFSAICAKYHWPSGLTMEHAVTALEEKLARLDLPKGRDREI